MSNPQREESLVNVQRSTPPHADAGAWENSSAPILELCCARLTLSPHLSHSDAEPNPTYIALNTFGCRRSSFLACILSPPATYLVWYLWALVLGRGPNPLRGDPSGITLAMILLPSFSDPPSLGLGQSLSPDMPCGLIILLTEHKLRWETDTYS